MIVRISNPATEVLRKSTFVVANDLGVQVPAGVEMAPEVHREIEGIIRALRISVNEAAKAALAGLLEREGLMPAGERPAVH